jgi:Zn-dependent peptidase ImmA (M78 family)
MATRAEIQRVVAQLLRALCIDGPPVPVERVAAHLGARVHYEHFDGDLSGFLVREQNRTIIGVNSRHAATRRRFTIAHEVGHLLLHDQDRLHFDRRFPLRLRDTRSSQAVDPDEIAANAFAAELLMPTAMVQRDLAAHTVDYEDEESLRSLAGRYNVSLQAMILRLVNLGYIDEDIDVRS